jgi:uncharacterized protein
MDTANAKRMMIFIHEGNKYHGRSLADAIIEVLKKAGCGGATVLRGVQGFGHDKQVHTTHIMDLSSSLPIVIICIDEEEKIDGVRVLLDEIIEEGLIVVDSVHADRKSKKS